LLIIIVLHYIIKCVNYSFYYSALRTKDVVRSPVRSPDAGVHRAGRSRQALSLNESYAAKPHNESYAAASDEARRVAYLLVREVIMLHKLI